MKGPKDSKESHTSVTMEGTLGGRLDNGPFLCLDLWTVVLRLCEPAHVHVGVCV